MTLIGRAKLTLRTGAGDSATLNGLRAIALRLARSPVWVFVVPAAFLVGIRGLMMHYTLEPYYLWSDAHIYFRATAAWVSGANPWATDWYGIPYAAPPPALLLNLPFVPFGENVAVAAWIAAETFAVAYLLRWARLPWWWCAFYPIAEGWTGGTPDLVLAVLVIRGGGWLAALTKPYSIPAMLADGRWRAVIAAGAAGIVTLPLLPWRQFFESRALIESAFVSFAYPNSTWGNVPLTTVAVTALATLGRRRALSLATPVVLAAQPHYGVFSLRAIAESRAMTLALTFPYPGTAALGVVVLAAQRWRQSRADRQRRLDTP